MPAATFEVEEKSAGWQAIQRMLLSLRQGGSYVKAGVLGTAAAEQHEDEDDATGLTNVDLAVIQEFGTESIPPRPFVNGTFALHQREYVQRLRELLPKVYAQRISIAFMMEVVGQQMASDMRNRISLGDPPFTPNAPATIKAKLRKGQWNRKGKAQAAGQGPMPLIDTGRLRNAISHEVVLKEES